MLVLSSLWDSLPLPHLLCSPGDFILSFLATSVTVMGKLSPFYSPFSHCVAPPGISVPRIYQLLHDFQPPRPPLPAACPPLSFLHSWLITTCSSFLSLKITSFLKASSWHAFLLFSHCELLLIGLYLHPGTIFLSHHAQLFTWMLSIEFRPLSLCSKTLCQLTYPYQLSYPVAPVMFLKIFLSKFIV